MLKTGLVILSFSFVDVAVITFYQSIHGLQLIMACCPVICDLCCSVVEVSLGSKSDRNDSKVFIALDIFVPSSLLLFGFGRSPLFELAELFS